MYSQKLNCAASLFPKQNYNILSSNSYTHISVRDLYISRIGMSIFCSQICGPINHSQTECRNWDWGPAILFLGIQIGVSVPAVETAQCTHVVSQQCAATLFVDAPQLCRTHFTAPSCASLICSMFMYINNPLPHGVLASFCLTAGGLLRPPEEDDISREKTILMT